MVRRSGLGRGLGALIPSEAAGSTPGAMRDVPVGSIAPNPRQPRRVFAEESLAGLTASVAEIGVLQPLLVQAVGEDRYELIAGERRWRAARRAGLPTVPVIVRELTDEGSLETALVENLHRDDLSVLEEATAYQQLMEHFELTQEQVAQRVGKSRSAVANTVRLLQLPPSVQRLLEEGRLSAGHARTLLASPDRGFQEALARRAVDEEMTVRQVEAAVRDHLGRMAEEPEPPESVHSHTTTRPVRPTGLLKLENLLAEHLSTRVSVQMGANRGRVTVEFSTLDDLERIYRAMTGDH